MIGAIVTFVAAITFDVLAGEYPTHTVALALVALAVAGLRLRLGGRREGLVSVVSGAVVAQPVLHGPWRTRSRRPSYRFSPANTTTYPIHSFWELAARCGFESRYVELVPEDELDERYAYFVMVKADHPPSRCRVAAAPGHPAAGRPVAG